jgi:hypothetical protein
MLMAPPLTPSRLDDTNTAAPLVVTVLLDNLMESEAINVTVLLAPPVVVKPALTVMLPP